MFGKSIIQNAVYPAKNRQEVEQFNADFFNNYQRESINKQNENENEIEQSLVVIKPNAAKHYGDVIRAHLIGQNFEIMQEKVFNLNSFVYTNMIFDAPMNKRDAVIEYMASGAVIA